MIEILALIVFVMICGPVVLGCIGAVLDGDWSGIGFLVAVGVAVMVLAWLF